MIRLIINGFLGKMGQAIASAAAALPNDYVVVAGVDAMSDGSSVEAIRVYSCIDDINDEVDAVIDFSRPNALAPILRYCEEKGICLVTGTTGFADAESELLDKYALSVPIFASGNMSLGVNLQLQLVKKAASTLGDKFDVEIVEKHHNLKCDSPSGTALMLADAASSQYPGGRNYAYGRYTRTERRKVNELGIHSIRGGTIVGEHEVYFAGTDEVVEINHKAYSKNIFAQGALRAAEFMIGKQPGLYNMQDIVLNDDVLSHLYAVDGQSVLTVTGLPPKTKALKRVFETLSCKGIFIDMISMAKPGEISLSVPSKQHFTAFGALEQLKADCDGMRVMGIPNMVKITVEGMGMEFCHGIAVQIFDVLAEAGINALIITTSETKISVGVDSSSASKALTALGDYLDL